MPTPSTFDHVLHADWGAKRTLAGARRDGDRYVASSVRPTTNPLREASAPSCLIGFDFPIGIPLAYARRVAVGSFRELLPQLGHGVWREFFSPAEVPAEISLHRPFYPRKPGGTSHSHLLSALGFSSMDELRRRCDLGYPGRAPAEVLFWTLGPRQVGRAAISGWRDVLMPALGDIRIWPLDGELEDLDGATVVCETYPADYYAQFGLPRAKTASARRQAAPTLLAVARDLGVELPAALRGEIARGFVDDDAYDAFVGLLGMLNVVRENRTARPPSVERARLEVEGWIFGQA